MASDRSFVRKAWLGGTIAIAFGVAAWALHRGPPALTAPLACPNVFDAAAVFGARIAPALPLGIELLRANAVLLVLAIAATMTVLRICADSWILTAAVGLAIVAQPILDPRMSPFEPAVLFVAAATFAALLAATRGADQPAARRWRGESWLALMVTALAMPRAALPLAAIAGGLVMTSEGSTGTAQRWIRAGLAAGALEAAALALTALMPGLPSSVGTATGASCFIAPLTARSATNWAAGFRAVLMSTGPFAVGLAALGAFSCVTRFKTRIWPFVAYAILPAMGAASSESGLLSGFATTLVGFWVCVALGLREIVGACRRGVGGRIAASLLVVLLPVFQISTFTSRPVPTETYGLERLSLRDLKQLLALLPDHSSLVSEDATTTLLLRGLDGTWQKMGKSLRLAPRDAAGVDLAIAESQTRVFALPSAQLELQLLGFTLVDTDLAGVSGLADVTRGGRCALVKQRWIELPELARASALSIAPSNPNTAIILYAGSEQRPDPSALNWPPAAREGFGLEIYVTSDQSGHLRFERDGLDDGLPADSAVRRAPFVTRLKLWRTPTAPAVLGVKLGVHPSSVVAHVPADAPSRVSVCPAFPHVPGIVRVSR